MSDQISYFISNKLAQQERRKNKQKRNKTGNTGLIDVRSITFDDKNKKKKKRKKKKMDLKHKQESESNVAKKKEVSKSILKTFRLNHLQYLVNLVSSCGNFFDDKI